MIKNKLIFGILLVFAFVGCVDNCKTEIVSDCFDELIPDDSLYESIDEFMSTNNLILSDTLDFDLIYEKYQNNRKRKSDGKIHISTNNKLIVDEESLNILYDEGYVNRREDCYLSIINLKIKSKFKLVELSNEPNMKDSNFIGIINFSDFYFNEEGDKAIFVYEFFCGSKCFKKELIYAFIDDNQKWVITNRFDIEIS